jgi:hypothetical protein
LVKYVLVEMYLVLFRKTNLHGDNYGKNSYLLYIIESPKSNNGHYFKSPHSEGEKTDPKRLRDLFEVTQLAARCKPRSARLQHTCTCVCVCVCVCVCTLVCAFPTS